MRALEKAKKVIAVELDPRMGAEVTKRVQGTPLAKKLEVILGDVIKMPELPACDALISNTPYQISSPLIFKMLAMKNPPRVAVLMVGGSPCSLDQQLTDGGVSFSESLQSDWWPSQGMPSTPDLASMSTFGRHASTSWYVAWIYVQTPWLTRIQKVGKQNFKPPPKVESDGE